MFCCPPLDGAISVPPQLQPPTALLPVPLGIWHMETRADPKVTVASVKAPQQQTARLGAELLEMFPGQEFSSDQCLTMTG